MKWKSEIPTLLFIAIPFAYLAMIWDDLPAEVPLHWNAQGEIDAYGSKLHLVWLPILLPGLVYFFMTFVQFVDPKKQMQWMGEKYSSLKFALTAVLSAATIYLFQITFNQAAIVPGHMVLFLGVLFAVLGNFMQTLQPNYFIGIRTPWTLENAENWRKTHYVSGRLWFVSGVVLVVLSLFLTMPWVFYALCITVLIIVVVPLWYSYRLYRQLA